MYVEAVEIPLLQALNRLGVAQLAHQGFGLYGEDLGVEAVFGVLLAPDVRREPIAACQCREMRVVGSKQGHYRQCGCPRQGTILPFFHAAAD